MISSERAVAQMNNDFNGLQFGFDFTMGVAIALLGLLLLWWTIQGIWCVMRASMPGRGEEGCFHDNAGAKLGL
jgi:hypothetical protein